MTSESARLDRNERRNSLAAFLRTIKFRKPSPRVAEGRPLARLHPRTPQVGGMGDDDYAIRSAN